MIFPSASLFPALLIEKILWRIHTACMGFSEIYGFDQRVPGTGQDGVFYNPALSSYDRLAVNTPPNHLKFAANVCFIPHRENHI